MAISDLTGTTWVFNDTITLPTVAFTFDFTDLSGQKFNGMQKSGNLLYYGFINDSESQDGLLAYGASGWTNSAYKTIKITGGTDAINTALIEWLQANATQQEAPSTDTKPIFKRINGSWVKQDAFERVSGAWVRISTKQTEVGNLLTTSNDEILQDSNENNLEFKEM